MGLHANIVEILPVINYILVLLYYYNINSDFV